MAGLDVRHSVTHHPTRREIEVMFASSEVQHSSIGLTQLVIALDRIGRVVNALEKNLVASEFRLNSAMDFVQILNGNNTAGDTRLIRHNHKLITVVAQKFERFKHV